MNTRFLMTGPNLEVIHWNRISPMDYPYPSLWPDTRHRLVVNGYAVADPGKVPGVAVLPEAEAIHRLILGGRLWEVEVSNPNGVLSPRAGRDYMEYWREATLVGERPDLIPASWHRLEEAVKRAAEEGVATPCEDDWHLSHLQTCSRREQVDAAGATVKLVDDVYCITPPPTPEEVQEYLRREYPF